ncbi:CAP domain-containing protein [Micromonospora sp. URMC 103]|uniref:CAP domain-containing protein n=1 Tax=Micromonospora sp. URMC 103 TaxID=3423406 RepID=UPI003F1BE393
MYGWTDPNDPDGATRRPEPPRGEPAWLTDRPAPRSAYLFGDDPDEPAEAWRDQPDGGRHDEPAYDRRLDQPTETWRQEATEAWRGAPAGRWHEEPAPHDGRPTGDHHRDLPTGGWAGEQARPGSAGHPRGSAGWPADGPADDRRDGGPWPSESHWAGGTGGDWAAGHTGDWAAGHTDDWAAGHTDDRVDGHVAGSPAYGPRPGGWDEAPTGALRAVDATAPMHPVTPHDTHRPDGGAARPGDTWERPADAGPAGSEGRHRTSGRRFPRPLLIGGAAAAATLVVSLGVGALALPGGDEGGSPGPSAVDDTVAAAPALPTEEAPVEPPTAPSPTASPSTVRPAPSASRTTTRPTPAASRTTAPSRGGVERRAAPSTGSTTAAPATGVSAQAREVVDLVNAERAKAGCNPVSIDDKLMTAAQGHSQDQADHQDMSHDGSDGSDPGERIERVGYEWRTYGENVAWNQKTPAAVMDAWMNSPGHRANILNCAFTEIGVGIASSNGPYWTQDFATPR